MGVDFDGDEAERWEDWDEDAPELDEDAMCGTIPIATSGCGNWYHLVITGPHAGEIWYDPRGGDHEPPMEIPGKEGPMHFDEWYETWLDECEHKCLPLTKSRKTSWWKKLLGF